MGRIAWLHLDIARAAPPATYDLVSAQFLHPPGGLRRELHRRLAAAVAPGGALLVVGHDRADLAVPGLRPPVPDLLFSADDVADALDPGAWDVVVRASRPRAASDPEGGEVTAHDAVLLARRRPA